MRNTVKRLAAVTMALSLAIAGTATTNVDAAAKKAPTLSAKDPWIFTGETTTVKVKKNKSTIVRTTWSVAGDKVVKLSAKKKTSAKVTAKDETGIAKVKAKVTYKIGKKKYTKTLKCTITVEREEDEPTTGDWQTAEGVEGIALTAEEAEGIQKAVKDSYPDVTFEPIAKVASQVVAGFNYRVIGKYSNAKENTVPVYAILQINSDVDGCWNAIFLDFWHSDVPAITNSDVSMAGAWRSLSETEVVFDDEEKAVIDKLADSFGVGTTIKPVAKIAMQVTNSVNYGIICESTPIVPDAQTQYILVWVSLSFDGPTITPGVDVQGTQRSLDSFEVQTLPLE